MRHTNGYYRGCYRDIDAKAWSCGEEMTLKDALDLWWNSVRIKTDDGVHVCYKNAYVSKEGTYELDGLPKGCLERFVSLDKEWDEDADGYPIVYARFSANS